MNKVLKILNKNFKKNNNFILCFKLPTELEQINFDKMLKYKKKGYQIGFSDHTLTINASLIAVSLGARVIENVTVNKKLKGPDHKFSLNMKEFNELVTNIRGRENNKIQK